MPLSNPQPCELIELIYVSAAVKPLDRASLDELLRSARRTNTRLGVSGMLLYDQGSFLQVLEGDPGVVSSLFQRIERDVRHHRVVELLKTKVSSRTFGDWSMGFVTTDELPREAGFNRVLERDFGVASFLGDGRASKARDILLAFRSGRWRRYVDASS